MRKTNNNNLLLSNGCNDSYVIYDPFTNETLTFFDSQDGDPSQAEWQELIIEEGVGGHLEQVGTSARFKDPEEAERVAGILADYLAGQYPDEDVELDVRQIRTEMTEMITSISNFVLVTGQYSMQADRGDEDRALDLGDEEEEDTIDIDWRHEEAKARAAAETKFPEVKASKKVKKSARSKAKAGSAKK